MGIVRGSCTLGSCTVGVVLGKRVRGGGVQGTHEGNALKDCGRKVVYPLDTALQMALLSSVIYFFFIHFCFCFAFCCFIVVIPRMNPILIYLIIYEGFNIP